MSSEGNGFGVFHTVQGEGQLVGYPTVFARLSGCNLRCAWRNPDESITTCDTPHTSFNPELNIKKTVDQVLSAILYYRCKHVVITGGEPYMQPDVVDLIDKLVSHGRHVTVETNGSVYRESDADLVSISLKLKSSSSHPEFGTKHEKRRLNFESLAKFVTESDFQFKFVLNDISDVIEIEKLVGQLRDLTGQDIDNKIWVMPQGIQTAQLDQKMLWLVELCKDRNWKLSDRLHIRIFGHMKGV